MTRVGRDNLSSCTLTPAERGGSFGPPKNLTVVFPHNACKPYTSCGCFFCKVLKHTEHQDVTEIDFKFEVKNYCCCRCVSAYVGAVDLRGTQNSWHGESDS